MYRVSFQPLKMGIQGSLSVVEEGPKYTSLPESENNKGETYRVAFWPLKMGIQGPLSVVEEGPKNDLILAPAFKGSVAWRNLFHVVLWPGVTC
jgi:hypothetical protein